MPKTPSGKHPSSSPPIKVIPTGGSGTGLGPPKPAGNGGKGTGAGGRRFGRWPPSSTGWG